MVGLHAWGQMPVADKRRPDGEGLCMNQPRNLFGNVVQQEDRSSAFAEQSIQLGKCKSPGFDVFERAGGVFGDLFAVLGNS